jgi:hypothetical protein
VGETWRLVEEGATEEDEEKEDEEESSFWLPPSAVGAWFGGVLCACR